MFSELGVEAAPPTARVIGNPFAGRFVEDLSYAIARTGTTKHMVYSTFSHTSTALPSTVAVILFPWKITIGRSKGILN